MTRVRPKGIFNLALGSNAVRYRVGRIPPQKWGDFVKIPYSVFSWNAMNLPSDGVESSLHFRLDWICIDSCVGVVFVLWAAGAL